MDALDRLLELCRAEGPWSAQGLAAFADGLRARARVALDERVGALEARIRELEREAAWRREAMAGLEGERDALKGEAQRLREARDAAAVSHEKLLAHHRDVVSRAAERFAAAAALPVWRFRGCRRLLADSAALFARERP